MTKLTRAVITDPPLFPGTRPRKALLQPIQHPQSIITQFQEDWSLHNRWAAEFIHTTIRAVVGLPVASDQAAVEDFYRTNRFDIAAHYNRALNANEPLTPSTVDQITGQAGRQLISLLDQHINLVAGLAVKLMEQQELFTRQQLRDELPATIVKQLGLIETNSDYEQFDPMEAQFRNGERLLRVLANVYDNVRNNLNNDVTAANDAAYQQFNAVVAADPYFNSLRPQIVEYLAKNQLPLIAPAQDIWSCHLLQTVLTANAEIEFTKQALPSDKRRFFFFKDNRYRTPSFDTGFAARQGDQQLQLHSFHIANLFALSLNLSPAASQRTAFPGLGVTDLQYFNA